MARETPLLIQRSIDINGYIIFDGAGGPWLDRVYAAGTDIKRYTHKILKPITIIEPNISPGDMDKRLLETIRGSAGRFADRGRDRRPRAITEDF